MLHQVRIYVSRAVLNSYLRPRAKSDSIPKNLNSTQTHVGGNFFFVSRISSDSKVESFTVRKNIQNQCSEQSDESSHHIRRGIMGLSLTIKSQIFFWPTGVRELQARSKTMSYINEL